MRSGIKEAKEFFTNKKHWFFFDKKEVRNKSSLSPGELKYIRGWTVAPFGYGYIIYLAFRKLTDIFAIYFLIGFLYREIFEVFLQESVEEVASLKLGFAFFHLVIYLFVLYVVFYSFRHGRRLSWNRGRLTWKSKTVQWKSVDELRNSENKWLYYNAIPSVILALIGLSLIFLY